MFTPALPLAARLSRTANGHVPCCSTDHRAGNIPDCLGVDPTLLQSFGCQSLNPFPDHFVLGSDGRGGFRCGRFGHALLHGWWWWCWPTLVHVFLARQEKFTAGYSDSGRDYHADPLANQSTAVRTCGF